MTRIKAACSVPGLCEAAEVAGAGRENPKRDLRRGSDAMLSLLLRGCLVSLGFWERGFFGGA